MALKSSKNSSYLDRNKSLEHWKFDAIIVDFEMVVKILWHTQSSCAADKPLMTQWKRWNIF